MNKIPRIEGEVPTPLYLLSTVRLLQSAYPDGIPGDDYLPLIHFLREDGMSNRNVATAIGCYCSQDYKNFLYDVGHVVPNTEISDDELARIEAKLHPFGLDAWRNED